MKNFLFITLGLSLVLGILIATYVAERPMTASQEVEESGDEAPEVEGVVPDDEDVVDEDETENLDAEPATTEPTVVKIFFSNDAQDPTQAQCEVVYVVERQIPATPAIAKKALDELLRGTTEAEEDDGYFTSINSRARVESLTIAQGLATVTFSEDFANGLAGSCKVAAVRAQIEQTLLQFATVQSVVIKINGVPDEEVLQP